MNEQEQLKELMDGISKEDFETIRLTNKRPESVSYDKYRALLNLFNKMKPKGQLVFQSKKYRQRSRGITYKKQTDDNNSQK